jgi:catechol 2,3-dioxygenase
MPPLDPEELEAVSGPVRAEIDPGTTTGPVHLTVADLERSIAYYQSVIGLKVIEGGGDNVKLGVPGRVLLDLTELPGARPADGYTGLYHYALLVPERTDLALWLAHAARERVSIVGASDHFVSEAIYLSDPDHHGIEIYWDRPRETWEGKVDRMGTWALDVQGLLGVLDDPLQAPFDGLVEGTVMGHVHLRVAEIESTVAFYRDVLGFGLMAQLGPQAAFLSAGGYHHHIGSNVWESRGAPPPPPGSAALERATILVPDADELERVMGRITASGQPVDESGGAPLVADPSGNRLLLAIAE